MYYAVLIMKFKRQFMHLSRYQSNHYSSFSKELVDASINDIETIISVSIHCSFDDVRRQSIEVLGSQSLCDLKDAICMS